MKWVKKKSKAPFFLVGLWWLLYALFLPLYRWQDFALCAAASLILFIVSRLLIADKTVAVRMTPKDLAELEAQKRLEQEEARRREQEALAAPGEILRDPQGGAGVSAADAAGRCGHPG